MAYIFRHEFEHIIKEDQLWQACLKNANGFFQQGVNFGKRGLTFHFFLWC